MNRQFREYLFRYLLKTFAPEIPSLDFNFWAGYAVHQRYQCFTIIVAFAYFVLAQFSEDWFR